MTDTQRLTEEENALVIAQLFANNVLEASRTLETTHSLAERLATKLAHAAEAAKRLTLVPIEEANQYSKILTALEMEEEGDPVEAVRLLVENTRQLLDERARAKSPTDTAAEYRSPLEVWPFASNECDEERGKLDNMLWRHRPTMIVPIHGEFMPLQPADIGDRYLVASDGLWLECRRPWLYLLWPVSKLAHAVEVPAGRLAKKVEIAFGKVPHHMIREFAEHGRRNAEREIGAWASWVQGFPGDAHLEWADDRIFMGTASSLEYEPPAFTETHCPCLDFHTHGTLPAGFSSTDNTDDAHDVKIAIVLGNLDQPVPSIAARLCCLGLMLPIAVDANEVFGSAA